MRSGCLPVDTTELEEDGGLFGYKPDARAHLPSRQSRICGQGALGLRQAINGKGGNTDGLAPQRSGSLGESRKIQRAGGETETG